MRENWQICKFPPTRKKINCIEKECGWKYLLCLLVFAYVVYSQLWELKLSHSRCWDNEGKGGGKELKKRLNEKWTESFFQVNGEIYLMACVRVWKIFRENDGKFWEGKFLSVKMETLSLKFLEKLWRQKLKH